MTQPRLVGDRYELGELIGYGGMAEVHRGRDARLGREVAIKILRPDLARDPSFLNRFRREAQSAAGLNHPAIVAVYDTGEDRAPDGASVPYIVMEYVEGRTLRDVLKAEGPLPPQRAMEITAEVAGALDFSHRNGLIHRDIKPANVMITRGGAVKVMDFGIARALSDNAATVTQTATVIGTAQYLSPEQARGESVDARSDVYSTGCLLYELLTGQPPFQGDSPVAVAYQHVRENAPSPSSINPAVAPALDSIVMKALAKNPLNRYQSAAEMREDLQRAMADRPVRAEAVLTDADRTQFIARSNAVPPRPGPVAEEYSDDGDHRGAWIWAAVVVALLLVIGVAAYAIVRTSSDKTQQIAVPNILGLTTTVANATLNQAGFQVGNVTSSAGPCTNAATPATDTVCTQAFAPGVERPKNSTIDYTTYKQGTVSVPPCQNEAYSACVSDLGKLGLVPSLDPEPSATVPANIVISTTPAAFTSVAPGSTVKVTYSTGTVTVPSEIGKAQADATNDLNGLGFTNFKLVPGPVTDPSKNGIVIAQNPSSGMYPTSTPITLTIGQYTAPTTSPPATCTTPPSSPPGSTPTPTTSAPGSTPSPTLPAC